MAASGPLRESLRAIGRLYEDGAIAGLGDGELLDRYAATGDAAAFEALVGRHGPMVLGVCRAALGDAADAEDAFQATFLLLARKAGALRAGADLAGWLHRVGLRVARQQRLSTDRRRRRERRAARPDLDPSSRGDHAAEAAERRLLLHREIDRLPDRLRLPVVRCYLDGRPQSEAASSLGLSEPTLRGRLARARGLLRARLERRGLSPLSLLPAAPIPLDPLPPGWSATASRAASWLSSGRAAAIGPSIPGWSLMTEFLAMMFLRRAAITAVVAAALGLGAWATFARSTPDASARPNPSPVVAPAPARVAGQDEKGPQERRPLVIEYVGRVLGPGGEPIEGAVIDLQYTRAGGGGAWPYYPSLASTDAEGRFRFEADFAELGGDPEDPKIGRIFLIAKAEGYGTETMPGNGRGGPIGEGWGAQPICDAIRFQLPLD